MRIRLALLSLAVLAALCLPAAAAAGVGSELRRASASLSAAVEAASAGDAATAAEQITASASHTNRARSLARQVAKPKQRARALSRVGWQYQESLNEYLDLIGAVDPALQRLVASASAAALDARERVVDTLIRLVQRLPEPAQGALLDAIARLETGNELESMGAALLDEDVIPQVKELIRAHLGQAIAHIQAVIDRLDDLAGRLPPEVRDHLQDALDQVSARLDAIAAMLDEVLAGLGSGGLGSFCDLLDALPVHVPICR